MIALANSSASRVEIVVKGFKDSLSRGWFYDRTTGKFQSDRTAETLLPSELRQLAAVGNELTYTVVPRGSGRRIGIDRDEDGYFDRDELDFGSDSANGLSLATNRPPVLTVIPNQTILPGQTLSFSAHATDVDIPVQQLTFTLNTNAPSGAAINATNGLFTWTPSPAQAPSTNTITAIVTDSGRPNRSDSKSFTVVVLDLHVGTVALATNGVTLAWTAITGRSYRVQYTNNLDDPAWVDASAIITVTNGVLTVTDSLANRQRFYRLVLEP
jgi:hypothetical protein